MVPVREGSGTIQAPRASYWVVLQETDNNWVGKTSMVAQADKNVNVCTLSLSVSMWISVDGGNNSQFSQVDSFSAHVELEVHLEEHNLGMKLLRYWIIRGGRNRTPRLYISAFEWSRCPRPLHRL